MHGISPPISVDAIVTCSLLCHSSRTSPLRMASRSVFVGDPHDDVVVKDGSNPIWIQLKRLHPFFLIAGVYTKDEKRRVCVDVLAKIYCGTVMLLNLSFIGLHLAHTLMTWAFCVISLLYAIPDFSYTFTLFVCCILWIRTNVNMQKCCAHMCTAFSTVGNGIPERLSRAITILQVFLTLMALYSAVDASKNLYTTIMIVVFGGGDGTSLLSNIYNCLKPLTTACLSYAMICMESMLVLWCSLLYQLFKRQIQEIEFLVDDSVTGTISAERIEMLRFAFETCLKVLQETDTYFSTFIGFTIGYSAVDLCLIVYFSASTGGMAQVQFALSLLVIFLSLAINSIVPVAVNNQVRPIYISVNCRLHCKIKRTLQTFKNSAHCTMMHLNMTFIMEDI